MVTLSSQITSLLIGPILGKCKQTNMKRIITFHQPILIHIAMCLCMTITRDVHAIVDYLNFGGRLGTGQKCRSGLDCATGACFQPTQRCQCQICEDNCNSGCDVGEICVDNKTDGGLQSCVSNMTEVQILSSDVGAIQFNSLAVFLFQALALLWLFILH